MRRLVEQHWPTLLVAAACLGLSASNVLSVGGVALAVAGCVGLVAVVQLGGGARVAAVAAALAVAGLWWGELRLDAMASSTLAAEIGQIAPTELVVTAPARTTPWAVRVQAEVRRFGDTHLRERVLLLLPVGRSPPRGAILETVARVTEPREPGGGFDERAWLARQGIHVVLRGGSWRLIGARGGIAGAGDRLRDRVERAVGRGTRGVRRALVLGIVLGEDEGLSDRTRADFRASGLYHLLAVSGQNVMFIAIGIYGAGWILRLPRVARELATMGGIVLYVLAVGWQPSVVRAGVAGALASLAWLASRPRDRWHFLALGALVLLVWAPTSILEPGFQLSFAAVAGIFVGVPRVRDRLSGYPLPPRLAEGLGVATVCGVVTAPIVLLQFGQAPLYTVPANVLAEPAVPLVLGLGLLAGIADPFAPGVAAALAWLAGWAAAWIELVSRLVASLPSAQIGPMTALVAALAVTGAWVAMRRGPFARPARMGVVLVLGGAVSALGCTAWWALRPAPAWHQPAGLRVTFLDVGQGDSTLLETPSARVLVDEGPPEAHVASQLTRMGIRSLTAIVLTHPQRDHVGGASDVIRRLRVGTVLDPDLTATGPDREEAVAAARERKTPIRTVRTGTVFKAGGLVIRVLWPEDSGIRSEDPNLNAVVLVATYGETDVYLSADAESDVTARLPLDPVEIMKVAHHGSADPGLDDELRMLRPRIAVISCGRNNDYGHPRAETLAALAASPGLATYRTDLDGRVVVESDGHSLRVRTHG